MLDAVGAGLGRDQLLRRQGIDIAVLDGARQHQRMGRGAQALVGDVELEARGPAEGAEIADPLVRRHALEDEGRARIAARRRLQVIGIGIEALRGEADADQALRGAAAAAPESARLAGEGEMHLGGIGLPGARAGLAAAHLDDAGQAVVEGGAPVEAVAAEIHQPPAPGEIGIEGIEHGARVIFGMAAGDDRAIGREQRQPLAVDVLVGDDVVALADGVQPIGDVEIGIEVPYRAASAGVLRIGRSREL